MARLNLGEVYSDTGEVGVRFSGNVMELTENLTLTGRTRVDEGGMFALNGFTLTISGPFEAGLYRVFDITDGGEVEFTTLPQVNEIWFGGPADGVADDNVYLQAAIESLMNRRGIVQLNRSAYRCLSALLNARRASVRGIGSAGGSGGGGTSIRFAPPYGIHSSFQDNFGYELRDMTLRSTDTVGRAENGQTIVDFTAQNYPRAMNLRLGYAEAGMRLAAGDIVECHYGYFQNIHFDQCFFGVDIGHNAHSQKFFGGRFWGCVHAIRNESSNDIAFIGSEFESDSALLQPEGGTSTPITTFIGCRDESSVPAQILAGHHEIVGGYWSGYARPREFTVDNDVSLASYSIRSIGNNGDAQPVRPNLLRNSSLALAPGSTAAPPGWIATASTLFTELISPFGRMLRATRGASSLFNLYQQNISLRAGTYTVGFGRQSNQTSGGAGYTSAIQIRANGGTLIYDSAGLPGGMAGGVISRSFDLAADYDDVEFRLAFTDLVNGIVFIYAPFLVAGRNAERYSLARQETNPIDERWASAMPTSGFFVAPGYVHNYNRTVLGAAASQYVLKGWFRITTGSAHVLNTDWVEDRALTGT